MKQKTQLNVFKTLTIILSITLVVIIDNQWRSEFFYDRVFGKELNDQFDFTSLNSSMDDLSNGKKKLGDTVRAWKCKAKYDNFIDLKEDDFFYNTNNRAHAYFFSIESFTVFANYVDSLTRSDRPPVGVRFYRCVSDDLSKKKRYYDGFLVAQETLKPITKDETKPATLSDAINDYDLALNTSWPCPDLCGTNP